jgi:L-rhamnose mutarotase
MIKKNIIKKYETFWLRSNKINNKSIYRNYSDDSKELNTTSLLYSIFIDSNASSLCESLLCDEDRRIMNDINIDDIMEIILLSSNNKHDDDDDEDNVYERLKIAFNDG